MTRHKIDDLLSQRHRRFSPLQRLLGRATDQEVWTAELQALMPETLRTQCRIGDIRGTRAVIVCQNAACATRVRFLVPELLEKLRRLADFRSVDEIQVRVSNN